MCDLAASVRVLVSVHCLGDVHCSAFVLASRFHTRTLRLHLQYLSPELMNRQQVKQLQRRKLIREFERFPGDTGSTEVQGAPSSSSY